MESFVRAKDQQAAYLALQITGGERQTGDPGSGPYDLITRAARQDRYGGVPRNMVNAISTERKAEKAARGEWATSKDAKREEYAAGKDAVIQESYDARPNEVAFRKALEHEMAYQIEKASRPSTYCRLKFVPR